MLCLDSWLFQRLYAVTGKDERLQRLMVFTTNWSSKLFYVIYGGMILLLVGQGDVRIIPFLVGPGLGLVAGRGMRWMWKRERPFVALGIERLVEHEDDASFPSMHALSAFVIAMSVWYLSPALGSGLLVLAGVTGMSRVMVGVHYPLDI